MRSLPYVLMCLLIVAGCARGTPDSIRNQLSAKWVGKSADDFFVTFGPAEMQQKLQDGRTLYTWERKTAKYRNNRVITSSETCIVAFLADKSGTIEKIVRVDDSLGAWHLSYCSEQMRL